MDIREAGDGAAAAECGPGPPKKYSWAEVRQAVHDLRKELSSMTTMVPTAITFRKLSNGKTRIYFLRTPQNGWEITLLYADVTASAQPSNIRLEWKPLIESNVALGVSSGKWSREEQLLWERQRVAAWGIASYELHPETGRVLFPCASSLFVAVPTAEESSWQCPALVPRVLTCGGGGAPLTPAMCPYAARLVAHTARGDVWLAGERLLRPARLTYACRGLDPPRLADDPRQAGVPCYVMQEEFSRYTGFWWQPRTDDDVYRIVYEEVDEGDVKIFSFPSSQTVTGDVEEFRFPRAGAPNAKSILRLVTFRLRRVAATVLDYYHDAAHDSAGSSDSSEYQEVYDVRWYDLRRPLQDLYPWMEYLVRVGWTPDGENVWVQLLDREQQHTRLVLLPLCSFAEPFVYEHAPPASPPASDHAEIVDRVSEQRGAEGGPCEQTLLAESAPHAWINVHDVIRFLPAAPGRALFLAASERTERLHLYLCAGVLRARRADLLEMLSGDGADEPDVTVQPVTAGEWEIIGRKIWVDEPRKLVYFVALRESPLERHLYVASYSPPDPASVRLLTTPGFSCSVDMDDECTTAVITESNISTLPCTRVHRVTHTSGGVALVAQGTLMERPSREPSVESRSWNGSRESSRSADDGDCETTRLVRECGLPACPPPQILAARLSCGAVAYCTLWRSARPGPRPTVLHVYGGPQVQVVTNSYKGIRQLRMSMLAARGFSVLAVDSRGSKHRGRAWEAAVKGRLGQLELDDQVEVLQWVAKETGCIDMDRIAIHGWSYGGYLALLALCTRPSTFRVAVAGAPVTCWRLYDSAYTERYMRAPAAHPHAYSRASVLAHAPAFPDQDGRLLIIHGLADENVHFCHTAALLAELVRLGKPHRVQIYPGERHSLRAMHAAKHYEATLLHFLHENL